MFDVILLAQEGAEATWFETLMSAIASPLGRVLVCTVAAAIGIFLLLPPRGRGRQFPLAALLIAVSVAVLLMPSLVELPSSLAFFFLEGLAILGGLGTISARSPVYSAIWFASALLSVGALLLLSGAQFLGLATVAVYAGAIVVTFLFVLMLAQPEGHAVYDRLGWGWLPTICASLAGTSVAGLVIVGLIGGTGNGTPTTSDPLRSAVVEAVRTVAQSADATDTSDAATRFLRRVQITTDVAGVTELQVDLAAGSDLLTRGDAPLAIAIRQAAGQALLPSSQIVIREYDVLTSQHVAQLGGELFSRHLISIEVAGVLLLAALVGAIAMAIHGNDLPAAGRSEFGDGGRAFRPTPSQGAPPA